jgi:ankyrin repeat protein
MTTATKLYHGLRLAPVSLLLLCLPRGLEACSCSEPAALDVEREQADAVFLGVVVSSRDLEVVEGPPRYAVVTGFRFRVSRAWKGVSSGAVEVGTSSLGMACGYDFEIGEEYLVFTGGGGMASASTPYGGETSRRSPDPPRLWTSSCSRSQHFERAETGDLRALGKPVWVDATLKESLLSEPLLEASSRGDTARVRALVAAGNDVNGRDRRHRTTALKAAASRGHVETVQALIAAGADLQVRKGRSTALEDAIDQGHAEVVRILLAAGARAGPSALVLAAYRGHGAVVEVLLAGGVSARGEPGAHALVEAAERNDVTVVRRLLAAGANPVQPPARQSALDVAAQRANVELIRLLLGNGARPTRATLDAAVQGGSREAVRLVDEPLRRTVGPTKPGPAALLGAAAEGNVAGIDLALEGGVDVDATQAHGDTALMIAVGDGKLEAVRRLLRAGANPNRADDVGVRPLMRAATYGNLEIMTSLLEAGAGLEAQQTWEGKDRGTALRFAVNGDCIEAVAFLLNAGANPNAPGWGVITGSALSEAVFRGSVDIVRVLTRGGADVNARRLVGWGGDAPNIHLEDAPLTLAADQGNPEMVRALLDAGARIDAVDAGGQTALERAQLRGHADVVALLGKAAAKP